MRWSHITYCFVSCVAVCRRLHNGWYRVLLERRRHRCDRGDTNRAPSVLHRRLQTGFQERGLFHRWVPNTAAAHMLYNCLYIRIFKSNPPAPVSIFSQTSISFFGFQPTCLFVLFVLLHIHNRLSYHTMTSHNLTPEQGIVTERQISPEFLQDLDDRIGAVLTVKWCIHEAAFKCRQHELFSHNTQTCSHQNSDYTHYWINGM